MSKNKEETEKKEKLQDLIKLVDDNFKIRTYQIMLSFPFLPIVLILVFFLFYLIPYFWLAPPHEQVSINLAWLAVGATFLGIVFSSRKLIQRTILKSNYKKIGISVKQERKPLLKALILMKSKEPDFLLSEIYKKYPSLFNEDNLVGMLYDFASLSVKTYEEKKTEATMKAKKENEEEPDTKSLIAEYQVLNEAIWRRGRDNLLVISIVIPATLGLVVFAIQFRGELGENIFFTDLPNAGFVPLASLILILISNFWCLTSTTLDNICFERLREIEDILHIEGHKYILEQIECNTWFKIRRNIWHFILPLFIIAYAFTAFWLFRETVIV